MKNKIFDCITFFNANMLFDLRYHILKDHVDYVSELVNENIQILEYSLIESNHVDITVGAIKMIYQLAQREAYIITFNQVFFAIGLLFFSSIFLMPLVRKVDLNKGDVSEGH